MMTVSISVERSVSISRPEVLFTGEFVLEWNPLNDTGEYDVAPDGRFLMAKEVSQEAHDHINIIFNWFDELKHTVPAK